MQIKKWVKYWLLQTLQYWEFKSSEKIEFICNCWIKKKIIVWNVLSWKTKSCWCYLKKTTSERFKKHWDRTSNRLYRIYYWMKARCNNKNNHAYKNYWWRWISIEWNSYEDFKKDMEESYLKHCDEWTEKQTTLDRIDNNWNYCKKNCRWATRWKQNNNRSNNKYINYKWESHTRSEWIKILWI
mgnify:CR=1 FL=1